MHTHHAGGPRGTPHRNTRRTPACTCASHVTLSVCFVHAVEEDQAVMRSRSMGITQWRRPETRRYLTTRIGCCVSHESAPRRPDGRQAVTLVTCVEIAARLVSCGQAASWCEVGLYCSRCVAHHMQADWLKGRHATPRPAADTCTHIANDVKVYVYMFCLKCMCV